MIIEHQQPNLQCITVPVEAFVSYDLKTLETKAKDFDVEKMLEKIKSKSPLKIQTLKEV